MRTTLQVSGRPADVLLDTGTVGTNLMSLVWAQEFIGFSNFYWKFIDGFSKITVPITVTAWVPQPRHQPRPRPRHLYHHGHQLAWRPR